METRTPTNGYPYLKLQAALNDITGLTWEPRPGTSDLLATTKTFDTMEEAMDFARRLNATYPLGDIFQACKGNAIRIIVFNANQLNNRTEESSDIAKEKIKSIYSSSNPQAPLWPLKRISTHAINGNFVLYFQNNDGEEETSLLSWSTLFYTLREKEEEEKKKEVPSVDLLLTALHAITEEVFVSLPGHADLVVSQISFKNKEEASKHKIALEKKWRGIFYVQPINDSFHVVVANAITLNASIIPLTEEDRKNGKDACTPSYNHWLTLTDIAPYSIGDQVALYYWSGYGHFNELDGSVTASAPPVKMMDYQEFSLHLRKKRIEDEAHQQSLIKMQQAIERINSPNRLEKMGCKIKFMQAQLDFIEGCLEGMNEDQFHAGRVADFKQIHSFRPTLKKMETTEKANTNVKKQTNDMQRKLKTFINEGMRAPEHMLFMVRGINRAKFFPLQNEIKKMQPGQGKEIQFLIEKLKDEMNIDWPIRKQRK